MPGPTSTRWRVARSAALSAMATQLAALGHLVGGGGRPDSGTMVAFHLIAAACAAAILATADAAIFAFFGALRRAIRVPAPHVPADRPLTITVFALPHLPRAGGALLSISPRRGPPVALL